MKLRDFINKTEQGAQLYSCGEYDLSILLPFMPGPFELPVEDLHLYLHEGDSKVTISFDTQEIKKESNLLFDIGPEYKAGDQVWYFDHDIPPSVCLCDILYVAQVDGKKRYRISKTNGRNIGLVPGSLLFSTREDLLYYYLQQLIPWRYGRDGRIHY